MKCLARFTLCGALLTMLATAEAAAQSQGKVAVGASVSTKQPADPSSRGTLGIGFLWRLGQGREGWGWKYGLNWYSADLAHLLGGRSQAFGELKVRPVMGGYGYTRIVGRAKVSANVLGGYAFTSFSAHPAFHAAYRRSFGADGVDTESSNTFVVKPEVSTWIDLSDKVGLNFTAGYMIARPTVTVHRAVGADRHHVNADTFMLRVGAVYSIF